MNRTELTESIPWRRFVYVSLLVIATVITIVSFLPKNIGPQFRYDVGKPWTYGSFIAKFDFPIYKTDEAIKNEQDSLLKLFQPYYNYDSQVERKNTVALRQRFPNGIQGLNSVENDALFDRLHRLYQAGIINPTVANENFKDSTALIRVVSGKNAQSLQTNCIYTTFTAYETLLLDPILMPKRNILQQADIVDYIQPNLTYDKERTTTERNDLLSTIPTASGMVMTGQKIIDRGDIVDENAYRVLASYEKEMSRRSASEEKITATVIGQSLYVLLLVVLFTIYIYLFRRDYFDNFRSLVMAYLMMTLFPILVSVMMEHSIMSVYILPFAMVSMFIRMFLDSRTAFVTHVTMGLICAVAVKYQYEFLIIQIIGGMVTIYSLRDLSRRAQIFKTAFLVTLSSSLTYFALQTMQNNEASSLDTAMYMHFIISGVLLLLAYPLMFLIEKTFGFVSNVTLFELSNTNKGILREMSEVAPGTFQHSITVGNLAAEIANRIGADSLLVRTGALYHDIGKMQSPVFFTENQAGVNPHLSLPYKESARIIIAHVTEGMKMAKKINLPTILSDFIVTHHGTGLTKYFYINYQNEHPDEEVDVADFSYPGPDPFTREQAILMMADTVEAASRSLPEYTEESISNLVNKLIDCQLDEGHFKNCPITFRDIELAKIVLIERLKAIYHTRISYPELRNKENDDKK